MDTALEGDQCICRNCCQPDHRQRYLVIDKHLADLTLDLTGDFGYSSRMCLQLITCQVTCCPVVTAAGAGAAAEGVHMLQHVGLQLADASCKHMITSRRR